MALTEEEKLFLDKELEEKISKHVYTSSVTYKKPEPINYSFNHGTNVDEKALVCETSNCTFLLEKEVTLMGTTYSAKVCRLMQPINQAEKLFEHRVIKLYIGDGQKDLCSQTAIDSKTNSPFWCPVKQKFQLTS